MTKVEEKELAKQLNIWFNTCERANKDFWNRNCIAKVLKFNLKSWGYFKTNTGSCAGRRKAKRKMDWIVAKDNGYEGGFSG